MAITSSEIKWFYSGGSGNTDPDASIGGARSTTEWTGGTLLDLFDIITGSENAAETIDFRCVYVRNEHSTLTWEDVRAYIDTQVSGGANAAIGLDPAGVNGTADAPADENTAPSGVSFSTPADYAGGLAIGDLEPNEFQAIWIRRTATDSAAQDLDGVTIACGGDSAE